MSTISNLIRNKMTKRNQRMNEVSGSGIESDEERLQIIGDYDLTFTSGKEFLAAADVDPSQISIVDKAIAMNIAEGDMINLRMDLEKELSQ